MTDGRTYKKEKRMAAAAPPPDPPRRPPAPLTDAERERIQKTIPLVKKHFPEMLDVIRESVALGVIDGWRNVFVELKVEDHGTD